MFPDDFYGVCNPHWVGSRVNLLGCGDFPNTPGALTERLALDVFHAACVSLSKGSVLVGWTNSCFSSSTPTKNFKCLPLWHGTRDGTKDFVSILPDEQGTLADRA